MTVSAKDAAAETCRQAFGSVLTQQGRGYYVTLELLAIAWGTHEVDGVVLPTDLDELRYVRRSHDFARRWMADDQEFKQADSAYVKGIDTPVILQALLESLRVPIPNRRTMPKWLGQHLYPYVGELIHYDAAPRRGRISIEQYTYRGAGGLAHKMLRSDPDSARLMANRAGLTELVSDSGGPLGQLAKACTQHDRANQNREVFEDRREVAAVVDATPWVDHLRRGVKNITGRDLVRAKQIELLMLWVPYCIARHQLDRAAQIAKRSQMVLPVALVQRNSPVRHVARRELTRSRSLVDEALKVQATIEAKQALDAGERDVFGRLVEGRTWRTPMLGFFTQTLATVGGLNAFSGSRYYTMQLPLMEALVVASLEPGEEMRFDDFCEEVIWGRYRMVVNEKAEASGAVSRIDSAELAENGQQLAADLEGLGLLTAYSDATRMVHGEFR